MMTTVDVRLPRQLSARLARAARRRHVTLAAFVREALELHLAAEPPLAGESCFDLAEDLAGVVRGPRDLSVDRRSLKDYGR
jgi:Ribbon-helix-helix protein, copG family